MKISNGPETAPHGDPGHRRVTPAGRLLIPLLLVLAASACGQRGPLYLPDAPAGQRAGSPAAAEAAQEEIDEEPNLDEEDEETPGT